MRQLRTQFPSVETDDVLQESYLKLRVADGLSHAAIAALLGVSKSTVRTQVARALQKCAQHLR